MVRQLWIFLLPEELDGFLGELDAIDPGLRVASSRYVRGDASLLLAEGGAALQFPTLTSREERRVIFHAAHSKRLLSHPILEGPLAGAWSLDESRSDCLVLIAPRPSGGTLGPARLLAETHYFEREQKVRKTPSFIAWASRVLRTMRGSSARTAASFIHASDGAKRWVQEGKGTLHYLHEPVAPEPVGDRTRQRAPQQK